MPRATFRHAASLQQLTVYALLALQKGLLCLLILEASLESGWKIEGEAEFVLKLNEIVTSSDRGISRPSQRHLQPKQATFDRVCPDNDQPLIAHVTPPNPFFFNYFSQSLGSRAPPLL